VLPLLLLPQQQQPALLPQQQQPALPRDDGLSARKAAASAAAGRGSE
jgi:hypothetical protein